MSLPHRLIAVLLACVTTTRAAIASSPKICENTCISPIDGNPYSQYVDNEHCQDGHKDADGAQCALGTDCDDCGPRDYLPPSPPLPSPPPSPPPPSTPPASPASPPPPSPPPMMCSDECLAHSSGPGGPYENNSFCQDGGPGATGASCAYGTDCTDCGPRFMSPPPAPKMCENTCLNPYGDDGKQHIGNGLCQDGGVGAIGAQCDSGTDCDDCGPRDYLPPSPPRPSPPPPPPQPSPPPASPASPPPPPPPPMMCSNECLAHSSGPGGPYANNSHCQDGGPGAISDTCAYGTDCTDCGPRYKAPPPSPPPRAPPLTGVTTTVAGSGSGGFSNGVGAAARFNSPYGVAVDPSGSFALVAVRVPGLHSPPPRRTHQAAI